MCLKNVIFSTAFGEKIKNKLKKHISAFLRKNNHIGGPEFYSHYGGPFGVGFVKICLLAQNTMLIPTIPL